MLLINDEIKMDKWSTLEDIFSQSSISPVDNYRDIIKSMYFPKHLLEPFIVATINNGNEKVVAENINAINLDKNWEIAKNNMQFKRIFIENFDKAIENAFNVNEEILEEINKENQHLLIDNWKAVVKVTNINFWSRKELIFILNSTEEGKKIVDENFPELFYGDFEYGILIKKLIKEENGIKDKIANLIVHDPTRMLSQNIESYGDEILKLLMQIDEILSTDSLHDSNEIRSARAKMENVIIRKFDKVLEKTLEVDQYDKSGEAKQKHYDVGHIQQIKAFFGDKNKINEKLAEYYDTISNNIKPEETMDLINLYSDLDVDIKKLDVETILGRTFQNTKDPDLQWAIVGIAKEMLKDQKLTPDKMQIYGSGQYSKTIKIGDYVFKVGKPRNSFKIKNDERIIQPLFRREIGDNDEKICIEVQDLVDKNWYEGLTEEQIKEELYKVFVEMCDRGIRWTDVRKENVGRLLKPNTGIYNINGQKLKGAAEAKGFIEPEDKEQVNILDAGELVVIDTDFIFDYKQESIYCGNYSLYREFKERYLKEKEACATNKEESEPALLTSAVEISKSTVTHEDIKTITNIVVTKNKRKEFQNDMECTKESQER